LTSTSFQTQEMKQNEPCFLSEVKGLEFTCP
jgi:hypothetical protein